MSYKLKDLSLVPPTGYAYTCPCCGVQIDGRSLYETVRMVTAHRIANGLSRANEIDVDEDVQTQLCQQLGDSFCKNIAADSWNFRMDIDTIKAGTRTLMSWATESVKGGNPYCSQEEAERRAAICATCFANKRMGECLSCGLGNLISSLMAESVDAGTTKLDDKLQSCMVCGCLLQKKVHIRADLIKSSDIQKAAYAEIPKCWHNKI